MARSALQNPFPQPTAYDRCLIRELVKVAARCYERGWSHGTAGNFSLRSGIGDFFWQSPTGLCKGELDPDHFLPIGLESGELITPGGGRPSGEMPVHLGIFQTVPKAKSVVHTHPPYLVAASRAGNDLVFCGEEMQKHLGCTTHTETLRVPVIANVSPDEMRDLPQRLPSKIDPKVPMVILSAHGVYAWGESPMAALSYIEAAEFLCRTTVLPSHPFA